MGPVERFQFVAAKFVSAGLDVQDQELPFVIGLHAITNVPGVDLFPPADNLFLAVARMCDLVCLLATTPLGWGKPPASCYRSQSVVSRGLGHLPSISAID